MMKISQKNNLQTLLNCHSNEDIHKVCEPLQIIGIHHFHFLQLFHDRSRISICNNKHWLSDFYEEELFTKAYFFRSPHYQNGATA